MKTYEYECCEQVEVHEELLSIVRSQMPEEGTLYDLAELFKVFGDSTRIRIRFVLFEAEVCVCDLAEALGMKTFLLTDCLINKTGKSVDTWPHGGFAELKCWLETL